jgi:hypothetical protein
VDRHKKNEMRRESLDRVRGEIVAERAAALARIGRTFARQVGRLEHMRREMANTAGAKRAKHLAAYEALRRKAETYRWYLKVQREVNGLYDGDTFESRYPIPGPLED